ncbi:MAG: large conductance mechanosensitive channel protein MscL [Prosthecobacter sp.]
MIPSKVHDSLAHLNKFTPLNEFKKFILKGNVIDLSTGVIIGAAFGNIVTAFTKGIVEPILAIFGGGSNPQWKITIWTKTAQVVEKINGKEETVTKDVPVLMDLGALFGAVLGFVITAAVVFFVIIKPMNKLMGLMKPKEGEPAPAAPPVVPPDIELLTEIRDLLKKQVSASDGAAKV